MNRIKQVTEQVSGTERWRQKYQIDAFGNRWILNGAGTLMAHELATPRAAGENDPSPFNDRNQWNGAQHDLAGNLATSFGDGTAVSAAKYFHDGENRLRRAEVNQTGLAGQANEYGYDGEGRRVTRKMGGVVKTWWVYDAMGQMVAEYGESAAMPCATCYLTADHLGSTRVVWGSNGQIQKLYDYAPYGEEVTAAQRGGDGRYPGQLYPRAGWQGVSLEFTGKERDAETGLDYFGARYMSAAQGRFTSPDVPLLDQHPEDPQSWNLFSYVRNNPLIFTDPTGNDCIYTNEFSSNGTVSVETGDCSKKGGTFVDGTVDTNSITYDRKKNELGYSYANAEQETGGAGAIGLKSAPTQDELRLAALGQAGQLASPVTDPRFIAGWYGAAALAGGGGYLATQFASLPTMEVAVGKFVGSWHVAYQATGGPWLHGMRLGAAGVEITEAAAAGFAKRALFRFSLKVLNPGAVSGTVGAVAGNCAYGACNAFLKGWGLK